ncbi:MAG TPA: rhomboid family intramembrane serine protease, partial [Hymenobacter sp.]
FASMFNLTPTVRTLLFINLGLYLLETQLGQRMILFGALYPIGSINFQPWQFVTYMFLHDPNSFTHVLFNMFGLISFGPLLEQRWGAERFLMFWLICGVGAGALYSSVRYYELHQMNEARIEFQQHPTGVGLADFFRDYYPDAEGYQSVATALNRKPNDQGLISSANETLRAIYNESLNSTSAGMLGASGALFGLLFAFGYLFPNTELMLLFFPFPIKAKYFVTLYALYELYAGIHRTPGDNVAHFAHLGGLLIGFIVLKLWERGRSQFY